MIIPCQSQSHGKTTHHRQELFSMITIKVPDFSRFWVATVHLLSHGTVWNAGLTPMLVALPRHDAECHHRRSEDDSTEERRHVKTHC